MPSDAEQILNDARAAVERALETWLPPAEHGAPRLAEAIRYSVFAGGKRLRPALVLASTLRAGGEQARALPYAAAVELLHTYSLVHDDLPAMDDDDLRRGRPTSHKVFGEAHAILVGDALHTLAFEILLTHTGDDALAAGLGRDLARGAGVDGMVAGQVEDLAADGRPPERERLMRIHRQKTAALIAAATRGGARAAGADGTTQEGYWRFGHHLGLAFQIIDDILDVTGTADSLGKTPGKDEATDKLTSVAVLGLEGARDLAEAELEQALAALPPAADDRRHDPLVALARFVTARKR